MVTPTTLSDGEHVKHLWWTSIGSFPALSVLVLFADDGGDATFASTGGAALQAPLYTYPLSDPLAVYPLIGFAHNGAEGYIAKRRVSGGAERYIAKRWGAPAVQEGV